MEVYWLDQTKTDVPIEDDWFSPGEMLCLSKLRFPKRRADWRMGRWTAKRALAAYLCMPARASILAKLEIRAAASGAPEALVSGKPANFTISISHRADRAVCAIGPLDLRLGCDLELVEPHGGAFVTDYFTAEEQTLVARASAAERNVLLAILWSAKESVLKALHEGLRVDTRAVTVDPQLESYDLKGWRPLRVRHRNGQTFGGWWCQHNESILTMVGDQAMAAPMPLDDRRMEQLSSNAVCGGRGL